MDERKKVVVIYDGDDWSVETPMDYELTRKAFERWHVMGLEKGIGIYRACIDWYDTEKNVFRKAWAFRAGRWQRFEQPIAPDLVYDKTSGGNEHRYFDLKMSMSLKVKMFNNPLFRAMVDNKLSQYVLFSEFMPVSFVAVNSSDLKEAVAKINTEKVVLKPLQGSGGYGIIIESKEKISDKAVTFPVLVQEFIKNSNGIPGFSNKGELADLRIVFMDHKPAYALSRVARKGSLFTNLHQGAQSLRVPLEAVPESVQDMAEKIINKLKMFTRAQYSLDFFFTEDGTPCFIEMNTVPGLCLMEAMNDMQLQKDDFDAIMSLV